MGFGSNTSQQLEKEMPSSGDEGEISLPVPPPRQTDGQEKSLPPVDERPLHDERELTVPAASIHGEERTPRQQLRRDTLETAPDSIMDNLRTGKSVEDETPFVLDEGPVPSRQEVRSVQNVSKYVRWDPNVAWAKHAIWGPTVPATVSSPSTSATGSTSVKSSASANIRGQQQYGVAVGSPSHDTEGMVNSISTAASLPSIGTNVKAQRQVRDILIFGEVRASSPFVHG